jgi:membrane protein DedA with SNARE-associated domain
MHSVAHLIHAYGLLVIAVFIGLESICIPLPGETALIVGSIIAGRTHELNVVEVIVVAAVASLIGRMIGYGVGARFGYWLLLRYGKYLRITEARIKLGQYLFLKHGGKIIIVAQFLPVLRAIAGILAGANRMPWRQFVMASAVGVSVWSLFFGFAAYMLGRQFERMEWSAMLYLGIGTTIFLIAGAIFIGRHEAQLTAKAEQALPGPLELS